VVTRLRLAKRRRILTAENSGRDGRYLDGLVKENLESNVGGISGWECDPRGADSHVPKRGVARQCMNGKRGIITSKGYVVQVNLRRNQHDKKPGQHPDEQE
jgi:hypothetical protein